MSEFEEEKYQNSPTPAFCRTRFLTDFVSEGSNLCNDPVCLTPTLTESVSDGIGLCRRDVLPGLIRVAQDLCVTVSDPCSAGLGLCLTRSLPYPVSASPGLSRSNTDGLGLSQAVSARPFSEGI